jgi:hypothetical protein
MGGLRRVVFGTAGPHAETDSNSGPPTNTAASAIEAACQQACAPHAKPRGGLLEHDGLAEDMAAVIEALGRRRPRPGPWRAWAVTLPRLRPDERPSGSDPR